jgi:hypothetical protein
VSVKITGIGNITLLHVQCSQFYISGIDLNSLAEEVLKDFSPEKRASNNRALNGAIYEDSFFEHGEQSNKLIKAISAVADSMGMKIINRIWAQVHHPYECCEVHDHLGGPDMGFVFYVKVPDGAGKLYFDFDQTGTSIIEPIEGMLVLFPAHLKHGVTKNLSNELRISISGDFHKQ